MTNLSEMPTVARIVEYPPLLRPNMTLSTCAPKFRGGGHYRAVAAYRIEDYRGF